MVADPRLQQVLEGVVHASPNPAIDVDPLDAEADLLLLKVLVLEEEEEEEEKTELRCLLENSKQHNNVKSSL